MTDAHAKIIQGMTDAHAEDMAVLRRKHDFDKRWTATSYATEKYILTNENASSAATIRFMKGKARFRDWADSR